MENYKQHQKSAILLMKTGGLLSMIADHLIMREVLKRYAKGERIKLTHRIVFELSLANFWGSFFSAFLSTWMVPKESGDYQSSGNTASCTAQGFFDAFFYGTSVMMNAILALAYCIIVRRGRRDEARSKRSLWLILGLPPALCFLLAIKPLFDQAYNYTDFYVCGIAEYPLGCLHDNYDYGCTRGSSAWEFKIARFTCICLANVVIVGSVCSLLQHIISTERRMNTDSIQSSNVSSNKATWLGISYVAAFMFSWFPWYIWQWIRITSGMLTMSSVDFPALLYIISITHPLQGVCNAIVYFRPRYLKFRGRDNEEFRLASVFRALDIAVPPFLSTSPASFLTCTNCVDWRRALLRRQHNDDMSSKSRSAQIMGRAKAHSNHTEQYKGSSRSEPSGSAQSTSSPSQRPASRDPDPPVAILTIILITTSGIEVLDRSNNV